MMNKSLRERGRESSYKNFYGFQGGDKDVKMKTQKRAAVSGGF
jgi:hypothetical protein